MTRDEAITKVTTKLWGRSLSIQEFFDASLRATEAVDIAIILGLKLEDDQAADWNTQIAARTPDDGAHRISIGAYMSKEDLEK